jgi:hypothetical protein
MIIMRVIAQNLIMYDEMKLSEEYVTSFIPKFILEAITNDGMDILEEEYLSMKQIYLYITTGVLISLGIKYSGSIDSEPYKFLLKYYNKLEENNLKVEKSIIEKLQLNILIGIIYFK